LEKLGTLKRNGKLGLILGLCTAFLLVVVLSLMLNSNVSRTEETVYIRADGTVKPSTAPITTGNHYAYTLVGNINGSLVIQRNDTILNGNGYTLQGPGNGTGLLLSGLRNATIGNITVVNFTYGIFLNCSDNNTLSGCTVAGNKEDGIHLESSSSNVISDNNVTVNDEAGIYLYASSGNTLSDNLLSNNHWNGVLLNSSSLNTLSGNTAESVLYGIHLYFSDNNTLSRNNVGGVVGVYLYSGVYLHSSCFNTLSSNNVKDCEHGIRIFLHCDDNTLFDNNISSNWNGISFSDSSGNTIFHNNFLNNTQRTDGDNSTNTWDLGYPTGGNYWSDYVANYPNATEIDGSGIWNVPYVYDSNNADHYPLLNQTGTTETS
jgi:parallel beta-helix repeat protein